MMDSRRAVDMARTIHQGDVRKGTTIPYLAHLLSVAAIVLEHGGSENDAIAALLHDTAEDHGGRQTIESIRAEFGDASPKWSKPAQTPSSRISGHGAMVGSKVAYLDKLAHEPQAAVIVSAADKLHNARAVLADYRRSVKSLGAFNKEAGLSGNIWYYTRLDEEITARLGGASAEPLAEELRSVVNAICTEAARQGQTSKPRSIEDGRPNRTSGQRSEAQSRGQSPRRTPTRASRPDVRVRPAGESGLRDGRVWRR